MSTILFLVTIPGYLVDLASFYMLVSNQIKAQNALPYLIVDFVWGFWLLLRGWRWHVHADWQNCGCYLGQLLRCFYEVSCLATTLGMPQRLAFAESGC